jgi:hypothetical protein
MENQHPPSPKDSNPEPSLPLDDLEAKLMAVEYEVWLKMHNAKDASSPNQQEALNNAAVPTPPVSNSTTQNGATEVVHNQDKYKLWAHTKV